MLPVPCFKVVAPTCQHPKAVAPTLQWHYELNKWRQIVVQIYVWRSAICIYVKYVFPESIPIDLLRTFGRLLTDFGSISYHLDRLVDGSVVVSGHLWGRHVRISVVLNLQRTNKVLTKSAKIEQDQTKELLAQT